MALVKCPKCGKEVSEKALKCVHCGLMITPNNKERQNKSPQQLFDEACRYYKDLTLTVKRLGLALESIPSIDYSTEIALKQIDWIVQYMLLTQALVDGEIDTNERIFIDQITEYGNLLGLINEEHNLNLSWESLEVFNNKILFGIVKAMVNDIVGYVDDFVSFIAVADAYTDHDYYDDFRTDILNIAECLAYVDGDNGDYMGNNLFDNLFGNMYLDKKREAEKNKDK